MKLVPTIRLALLATLLLTAVTGPVEAQRAAYDTGGGMIIGFGLGASYQQSDMPNSMGAGFDFILGHHLWKEEGAFLSADWKFRFLAGRNEAFDHRINIDNTYSNVRYDFFKYDLEFGLTLNRLRERTRIVVSGFAGGGITHGKTFADLLDDNGNPYDFSVIDPTAERSDIYNALRELSDGDFETKLTNRAALLPTAGLFIGYQFSPSFTLGIEHKTNFYLTEHNSAFGINLDNRIVTGSPLDRNHYTSLVFRWSLGAHSGGRGAMSDMPLRRPAPQTERTVTTIRPTTDPVPVPLVNPPSVTITSPVAASSSTTSSQTEIVAVAENITSRQGLRVAVNNSNSAFTYNGATGVVRATISLREGANNIVVTATNDRGSASDTRTINFVPVPPEALPVIRITNPTQPVTVGESHFPMRAQTTNIREWHDLSMTINGEAFYNFTLTEQGIIMTNVGLKEGVNRIEIGGKNEYGTTSATTTITYAPTPKEPVECPVPIISMFYPSEENNTTDTQSVIIRAAVSNITSPAQITLLLNGIRITDFTFARGELVFRTRLIEGVNRINITATNNCGLSESSRSITYIREIITPPDSVAADIIIPVVVVPDTIIPVVVVPDTIIPVVVVPDTIIPVVVVPDTIIPVVVKPDTIIPVVVIPDTIIPVVVVPDTIIPVVVKPDTIIPVVVIPEIPCPVPLINFSVTPATGRDTTHLLRGRITNTPLRANIGVRVNNKADTLFRFTPRTGEIVTALNLPPGRNIVVLTSRNECGESILSDTIMIAPPADGCGIRINPGNASWQFCLITPEGTINRDSLTNNSFSYSGPASSLFFMPIAGGGQAIVNGQPFNIRQGQYHLFTGNLTVTVTSQHPQSMGQWTVCIVSDTPPVSGTGNNRPRSPCEQVANPPGGRR